jgi:4-hydroxybenzoate polyprenyltransferase
MALYSLWLVGSLMELGLWYRLGLGAAALFAIYEQWLIREREPSACLHAFLHNNYFGMAVFIGILLEYTFNS